MAVTKIWPVRGRLDSLIRYAENEEKTRMPDLTGLAPAKDDLAEVLQYAANHSKTTQDRQLLVSGVNCLPEIARQQMELTKRQFGDTAGIVAFHAYQSFPPEKSLRKNAMPSGWSWPAGSGATGFRCWLPLT